MGETPVSTPSRSGVWALAVTSIWQSVCRMRRPSCSPRYVELIPTTTLPESAAAASQKR